MKTLLSKFDKAEIAQLPKVLFPGRIIVITSEEEAEKAVDYLLSQDILGLDTETKPCFVKGKGMNPVALLQVSTHNTCFLFRLSQMDFPDCLVRLLSDDRILKVGLSLHDDYMQLSRRKRFKPGRYAELQKIATDFGITDKSLQKLYANLFHQKISKSQQLTNWENEILTDGQKAYAATDAWACIMLYKEFRRLKEEGYELTVIPEPEAVPLTPEEKAKIAEKARLKKEKERARMRAKKRRNRAIQKARKEKQKAVLNASTEAKDDSQPQNT